MSRTCSAFTALALSLGALVSSGCTQQPSTSVPEAQPAEVAAKAPEAGATPAAASQTVAIFYAQVGSQLGPSGLIAESQSQLPAGTSAYAMGVFKGAEGTQADAAVEVLDASGAQAFIDHKAFTVKGETPVVFPIGTAERALKPGNYTALFRLDGNPCWEIKFSVAG